MPKFKFTGDQSHTNDSMEILFEDENAQKDIPRTLFRFEGEKNEKYRDFDKLKEESKVIISGKTPVELSSDESRALFAFSMSVEREHSQGGMFRGFEAILQTWLIKSNVIPMDVGPSNKSESSYPIAEDDNRSRNLKAVPLIKRSSIDNTVLLVDSSNEVLRVMTDDGEKWASSKNPLIVFGYQNRITKKNGTFYAEMDNENYIFQVDEDLWRDTLLPAAREALQSANQLTDEYLIQFIPYLIDPDFTKIFAEKLAKQAPETIKFANYLIAMNFDKKENDLVRIANELNKYDINYYLKTTTSLMQECSRYHAYLENKQVSDLKKLRDFLRDKTTTDEEREVLTELNRILIIPENIIPENPAEISLFIYNNINLILDLNETAKNANDQEYVRITESILKTAYKMEALDELKKKVFNQVAVTDNKELIKNFSEEFYKNEKAIFTQNADQADMTFISNVKNSIKMISPPLTTKTLSHPEILQDQESELINQLEKMKQYIESLPEAKTSSSHYRDLKYQLDRRVQLIKDVGQFQTLKDKLDANTSAAIEHLPDELHMQFSRLPKLTDLEWVAGTNALEQFQTLCHKAVDNLKEQKKYMSTSANTEAKIFNISKERIADETDAAVIARKTKEFLGLSELKPLDEIHLGKQKGTLTDKLGIDDFSVCKVETGMGVMGYVETRNDSQALSTVYSVPKEFLPENIWSRIYDEFIAKMVSIGYPKDQVANISQEQFNQLFQRIMKIQTPYWQDNQLEESILQSLRTIGIPRDAKIAKFLSDQYKRERDELLYDSKTSFPRDELIQLAKSQFEGLMQKTSMPPLMIRIAFNEANVKAVMLHARAQGFSEEQIINS